ncbi:hypothetical protein N0V90_003707 [Kalmusia sp. IMI 367209]|nr:hypothetical protein N0V90_003707 [Kalmusia sp. IMI 367209]
MPYYDREDWYEIRDIPGKGKGVIARRKIRKGSIIMLDSPGIIASAQLPMHVAPVEGFELFEGSVQMLLEKDRDDILALDGRPDVYDILQTNAFSCRFDDGGMGDEYLCLFPLVSRINHACRPNANVKFIPRTLLMEIRALRGILPGEEINTSYGKVELKYAERQDLYRNNWKFVCTCDLCTAGESAIAENDRRRERFAQLRRKLNSLTAETYDVQRVIAWEKEVFEISEQEGFEVIVTEDMERMAYVYAGLGKRKDAILWAEKAKDNLLRWSIEENSVDDNLQRIEELLVELGSS